MNQRAKKVISSLYNRYAPQKLPVFRRMGIAPLPRSISLFPTLNCNVNCVMCYAEKYSDLKRELRLGDYSKIIDEVNGWITKPYFYILGGEPLVYQDIEALIKLLSDNGYEMVINTNGLLLSQYAGKLVDYGVKTVIVSIDGQESVHDAVRRHKGLFRKAIDGINEVNRLKRIKKAEYPKIDITSVILPQNYLHMYDFLVDLKGLDIRSVSFDHIRFMTRDQYDAQKRMVDELFPGQCVFPNFSVRSSEEIGIHSDALRAQIDKIDRDRDSFNFRINWVRNFDSIMIADYYTDRFSAHSKDLFCSYMYDCLAIGPYGEVFACHNYVIGNVREMPLKKLWNSNKAVSLRKRYLNRAGGFPSCKYCGEYKRK